MAFKDYTNPLYDVVDDEQAWTNGLCAIFAHALVERLGLPLKAVVVRSAQDRTNMTLVHAFGVLPEGRVVDARGIRPEAGLLEADYADFSEQDWRAIHCAQPGEAIEVVIVPVSVEELWDLNPEDLDATNAAHEYIERHPELFKGLAAA